MADIANNLIDGIYDVLIANAAVSGAVGDRIYQEVAAQKAIGPYIVMRLVDKPQQALYSGYVVNCELQVDVFNLPAVGPKSLRTISNDVYEALNGTTFTASGVGGAHVCQELGMMRSAVTWNEEYLQCTSLYRVGGDVS
jgi:hypothetical protein